ncbi:MAG: TIGR03663 family protein [Verrucomicrobiales bacterium]|nr:TIGR03663 family protein [Verrucomicrobiales bacterium]
MNRWSALAALFAVLAALALRVPKLETRPLHNDEAVNAVKLSELWEKGSYAYDPDEYHGPSLHYASLPFLWLSGTRSANELSDATLRWVTVAFGVALILLLLLLVDGIGRPAVAWASLFIAISPAMVFYSRYFIHEMLLVFFTALTLGAGWRYSQTPSALWALIAGAGLGLMFTTKETFVLTLAAMGIAGVITAWWATGSIPKLRTVWAQFSPRHVALAVGATLLMWLLLFSSFFTHLEGLPDSIRTYLPWLKRAGGHSPHIHPWYFYLERLAWFHSAKGPVWSEGTILLLAAIGIGASLFAQRALFHRFLALYTLTLTGIYSAISYKTPWCLLNFYFGMILMAGVGAAWLWQLFRSRIPQVVLSVGMLLAVVHLAGQSWLASSEYASDRRTPYVYAQTVPDVMTLVDRAEGIGKVAPTGYQTVIKIIAPESDYWPLPWYLRRFQNLGWYEKLPEDPFAPIVMVSSKLDARLDERSEKKWIMVGLSELRPGKFFELYVELELWKKYVETLPRDRE